MTKKKSFTASMLFFSLVSLLWLLFRTGTKPSRITYPCQRAASSNLSLSLSTLLPLPITAAFTAAFAKTRTVFSKNRPLVLAISAIIVISGGLLATGFFESRPASPNQEILLPLESQNAIAYPSSEIYVMNGRTDAHINTL
ncbi:MAG: hypothetical protein ACFFGZ_19715, partial [Candidatus Thorarchaeota archaeon]